MTLRVLRRGATSTHRVQSMCRRRNILRQCFRRMTPHRGFVEKSAVQTGTPNQVFSKGPVLAPDGVDASKCLPHWLGSDGRYVDVGLHLRH
jgi:hypothetical protein